MLNVKILCLFVCLGSSYDPSTADAATKYWKYNNDVSNPTNWERYRSSNGCSGIIFPENLGSVGTVFQLTAHEIQLPYDGELEIREGGFIEISNDSDQCIRVKELEHKKWLDPNNWSFGENVAVPDAERIPCTYDDVVFPSKASVAVVYPEVDVSVNSIQIGGVDVTDTQWQNFLQSDYGIEQFRAAEFQESKIEIKPHECREKSGCPCHDTKTLFYWLCDNAKRQEEPKCLGPIRPVGHCNNICGGIVLMDVLDAFFLNAFREKIPKYDGVDVYASKVEKFGNRMVQVVFVEKSDYIELSASAAQDLHNLVSKDLNGYKVKKVTVEISGLRLPRGSAWKTALSIIFGTFVAALFIYLSMYIVYVGPLKDYQVGSRLPITQFSFGNLRPFFFSKFENREEGRMTTAPSMASLGRAFDNPLYGSRRLSTDSIALDVVALIETPSTSRDLRDKTARVEEVEIEDVDDEEEK